MIVNASTNNTKATGIKRFKLVFTQNLNQISTGPS